MKEFKSPFPDSEKNGLKYEFLNEVSPGIWRITSKSDRMEYLAQNATFMFFGNKNNHRQLTDYGHLLATNGENMIQQVKVVLNHPNLVSLVDSFAIDFSPSDAYNRKQWFMVWDYCDAGNLGNYFKEPQPRPQDRSPSPSVDGEDEDTEMEDSLFGPGEKMELKEYLPESFCWHVLVSVLRALTWLHDGVRDVVIEGGQWTRLDEDPDWSPMLHRNITPQNIFLGHPRRKESYGPVKLGNYGRLFVSGHCQTVGDKYAPTCSKVIAPHPSKDYEQLSDLIALDSMLGNTYPYQPDQPYTMISEYRALGEIIQGMMIEPTGGSHLERIQSRRARENLEETKYTGRLKNFVVKLMEADPWHKESETDPNPAYVTSGLYREALEGVQWFIEGDSDKASAYVTSRMAEAEDYVERTEIRAQQLFNSYANVEDILLKFETPSSTKDGRS
ncbi:hypothetical protein F5Y08DRAFT_334344 [Xylaria arbuscula]|nr:hypothetical protein F5Y08DRAFT_334344 [Xylaria arbuscula]